MSEPSSTTADAATGMSTNAFLEARRPTLARRLLSLLVSVYGIVWAVFCMIPIIVAIFLTLKSSKAPTNYFTPNILRKSWSRLVVSVVHLDALAFPVAAT